MGRKEEKLQSKGIEHIFNKIAENFTNLEKEMVIHFRILLGKQTILEKNFYSSYNSFKSRAY
jgi:hypothetical protein